MNCKQVQPLIPSYADGELSELQAGPFRKHLLECQPCRAMAQAEKATQDWFVPTPEIAVPEGFAARVARRAFAGDVGVLVPTGPVLAEPQRREAPILQFSLRVAMAAALVLMVAAISLGVINQPDRDASVGADPNQPSAQEVLQELDELKAEERAAELKALEKTAEEADAR